MSEDLEQALATARAELDRLRLTLEVVGTVDLEVGILNENGIVDAIERARRWHARRGDVFGVLAILVPDDAGDDPDTAVDVAATIAAGLREVDDVGRLSPGCYVGVLSDLVPGSLSVVADRIRGVMSRRSTDGATPTADGRIAGVELHRSDLTARSILERVVALADDATGPEPILERDDPA